MNTFASCINKVKDFLGLQQEVQEFFDTKEVERLIKASTRPSLSSYLPYVAYDEKNELFINKTSIGFILEAVPLLGSSEEIEKQLNGLFQYVLPIGSNLQFLLLASPKIAPKLAIWEEARQGQGELFKKLATKRREFIEKMVMGDFGEECNARIFKILISFSCPGTKLDPVKTNKINLLKTQLLSTFRDVGMSATVVDVNQFLQLMYDWINPSASLVPNEISWNELDPLATQIVDPNTCIKVKPQQILINNREQTRVVRILTPQKSPDEWCLSEMGQFIGDFFEEQRQITVPFMLHYGVHISDVAMLKTKMMAKGAQVERMAATPLAKWVPSIRDEASEWNYVRNKVDNGHRFIKTHMAVILFAEPGLIDVAQEKVENMFKCKGWVVGVEYYTNLISFISCLPMCWGEKVIIDLALFRKAKTTLSSEAVKLLPIQGEWYGTVTPGMLFFGRRGQVFFWDAFDNRAGNFNVSVCGKSGSGKSVFMEEMVVANVGRGGRTFVLDVGRSFERVCKLIGGSFVEFSTHSPICINPFTTIPVDDPAESLDALAMLKPIVSLMAAPTQGTTDLENALIEKAILYAWEKHKTKATISHIAEGLLLHDELSAQNLAKMLFPYTKDGTYGRFFEGDANVDLTGRLVVFELEELKERKDLQAVIVQIMILQIANQVYLGDRKTATQVVLDEAWDMLRGEQSALFIETAARRLRKYKGSLIVGTQSVRDFYASPGALAAFENSDWTVLLEQKGSSITQLKTSKHLDLTPYMEQVLKTVKTKKGKYSEVFILGPDGFAVGRLMLERFSQLLYTTDAQEFGQIEMLRRQGLTLPDALEKLANG